MKPYKETKKDNVIRRTFSKDVPISELVWHRDKEDRIVKVLSETDWMIQFDNELPVKLNVNEEYYIPKESFHRVIKGNGNLMVEITETDFVEEGKKDACYHKVRARYDVWPSAYASGALVKCRKVGASNWGNKSESEEPVEEKWSEKYKRSIDCNNPKGFSQRAHCQGRKKTNESEDYPKELINLAHSAITRKKGKDYAPDVHELQAWVDDYLTKNKEISEAKKTDFSKEKEQGLHGWFARKGGEGKSQGWVDCNTCKTDKETGRKKCKPCGREEGEKRKYPACRPTPSACGTPKKGKSWGKKSGKTNENLSLPENLSIFVDKNHIKDMLRETFNQDDVMTEPMTKPAPVKPKEAPTKPFTEPVKPSRKDKPFLPMPNVQPDPKANR